MISNPNNAPPKTYNKTKKILNNPHQGITTLELRYMTNIVQAIDKALDLLEATGGGQLKRTIIEDAYWHSYHKSCQELGMKYYVHYNTIRHYEYQFFYLLADCLGIRLAKK